MRVLDDAGLAAAVAGCVLMPPGAGAVIVRAAAVIPVVLLIVFTGVLCLLGLVCDEKRRAYVTTVSGRAMSTIEVMLHGPAAIPAKRQQRPSPR